MTRQDKIKLAYAVRVRRAADTTGYHVTYTPRGPLHAGVNGETPTAFEAIADVNGDDVSVRWVQVPTDPQITPQEFEQDVRERVSALRGWLDRLSPLVDDVEAWAKEIGWATRRIDKQLDDSAIGKYDAQGLLMQEGSDRVLLEPIGRSATGAEGIVDLYLLPAYDDVASLYYYEGRWNLHHVAPGQNCVSVREAQGKPLSKEALQQVLTQLRQHAA
jgi:hypothetical protein